MAGIQRRDRPIGLFPGARRCYWGWALMAAAAIWRRFWKNNMRGSIRQPIPCLHLSRHAEGQQRVTAQLEEIVFGTLTWHFRQITPDGRQREFHCRGAGAT